MLSAGSASANDRFGWWLSLSLDGYTLLVSAYNTAGTKVGKAYRYYCPTLTTCQAELVLSTLVTSQMTGFALLPLSAVMELGQYVGHILSQEGLTKVRFTRTLRRLRRRRARAVPLPLRAQPEAAAEARRGRRQVRRHRPRSSTETTSSTLSRSQTSTPYELYDTLTDGNSVDYTNVNGVALADSDYHSVRDPLCKRDTKPELSRNIDV